jgi:light-regulated signal transduction histidine kinase (bacteriophytochrome)
MNLKDLVTVLGHELRTPLAAIMGYQELLIDGVYGQLGERTNEPLSRIHSSALQLLNLIDGLQELAAPSGADDDELTEATTDELVARLADAARPFAESRGVKLDTSQCPQVELGPVRLQRLLRAAELATVAAVKSSASRTLRVHCENGRDSLQLRIEGSALDPVRDSPLGVLAAADHGLPLNAARLRLAMACAALTPVQGSLELQSRSDGTAVILQLPLTR